jgi:signal transduction histidine kinase
MNNRRRNRYDINEVGEGNRIVRHMGMEILEYYKVLPNGKILILRISTDSIKSTVGIVNKFFFYAGIVILLGSLFFVYIFSLQITKPVIDLNNIIKGMVKMDFSYRLNLKSGDEFQELGENINFLASELEKNIEKFKISNKKLQEEVNKRRKIDELRKEFIASVTHEIKTPVTVINTHAEMLLYDLVEKEEEKKEYLKTIMSEGNNISALLTELIEIIKLEEKIIDIKVEELDLSRILEEELNKYKIDLEEKNVTLEMNLKEGLIGIGDESKIRQVLTNIISNAVSYVNIGGELIVNLFSEPSRREPISNREVIVEIINTGSTIPEEKIENIWKAFYTIEESRNKKYGGTGLGLTIVSGILERHDSQFGVENLENGVKFWFSLKLKV